MTYFFFGLIVGMTIVNTFYVVVINMAVDKKVLTIKKEWPND